VSCADRNTCSASNRHVTEKIVTEQGTVHAVKRSPAKTEWSVSSSRPSFGSRCTSGPVRVSFSPAAAAQLVARGRYRRTPDSGSRRILVSSIPSLTSLTWMRVADDQRTRPLSDLLEVSEEALSHLRCRLFQQDTIVCRPQKTSGIHCTSPLSCVGRYTAGCNLRRRSRRSDDRVTRTAGPRLLCCGR